MPRPDIDKLVRILGLLGSDQSGERASAALAAHRLVETLGTSWAELLNPDRPPKRPSTRRVHEYGLDTQGAADARMRQLKATNDRLERQNRAMRRRLAAAAEEKRRQRTADLAIEE